MLLPVFFRPLRKAGQFQASMGQSSCTKCATGRFQGDPGSSFCNKPDIGFIVLGDGTTPFQVPKGSYISQCVTGDDTCNRFAACPQGWHGTDPASERCIACSPGETSFKGSIECHDCDKGRYGDLDSFGLCKNCQAGQFTEKQRSTSCSLCPRGYKQETPGQSFCTDLKWRKAKECKNDQYLNNTLTNPTQWTCDACPPGGHCNGPIDWNTLGKVFW